MDIPTFDDYCFACGVRNPIGIGMQVNYLEEIGAAESLIALPREYQGCRRLFTGDFGHPAG